ncbi:MAG: ABC transporter permease [Fervidicoccaceae archaeon]
MISKETREMLRDPRIFLLMIVAPIIIFVLLGTVMGYATEKTVQATTFGLKIAIINNDEGEFSRYFIQFLRSFSNGTVNIYPVGTDPGALFQSKIYDAVLVIPSNFTESLAHGKTAVVNTFYFVKDLSISSTVKFSSLNSAVNAFQQQLLAGLLSSAYPNLNVTSLFHIISLNESAILGGREVSFSSINSLLSGAMALIVAPLMIFSIASSLAASSMGIEKEEKTLEILLTLPIKRSYIMFSKVFGAFILSLAGMIGMGIGFYYYISSVLSGVGGRVELVKTLSILSPSALAEAAIGLLLSLLFILGASILISSLASNVREAQAMTSYTWLPILIPYILLMYIDLSQLNSASVLAISLIPASTPLIALKSYFQGWVAPVIVSFAANILYFAVVLYLGAKWFEGERILSTRVSRKNLLYKLRK